MHGLSVFEHLMLMKIIIKVRCQVFVNTCASWQQENEAEQGMVAFIRGEGNWCR